MIETSEVVSITLGGQDVIKIEDLNGNILWEYDYANSYFSIRNPGSSAITLTLNRYEDETPSTFNVEKLGDGDSDFVVWGSTASTLSMSIPAGKSVKFRALNNSWRGLHFDSTGDIALSGNIMSLVAGSDYRNAKSLASYIDGAFPRLFSAPDMYFDEQEMYTGFTPHFNISDITKLTLPSETLSGSDYYGMFRGCTKITRIPKKFIRAINGIANNSCAHMFNGCTGLTTITSGAISNPGSVGNWGMANMFKGCTSLSSVPTNLLSASSVNTYGYYQMFYGCTSLTGLNNNFLPATTLGTYAYSRMFQGCSNITTAPTLASTNLSMHCYDSMFLSCSRLTTAPALPANTIPDYAYSQMFQGCTSLTTPPIIAATTINQRGMDSMFNGCTSLDIPNNYELLISRVGQYGLNSMFQGCTSLTKVPESMLQNLQTVGSYGCASMFDSCTNLTQVELRNDPDLTGTYNFQHMFSGCSRLSYISCDHMATTSTTTSTGPYCNWVYNVANSGSFYQYEGANWNRGVNGVPLNWSLSVSDPMTLIPLRIANNNDEEITLTLAPRIYEFSGASFSTFTTNLSLTKRAITSADMSSLSQTHQLNYKLKDGTWTLASWGSGVYNDVNITIPANSYVDFQGGTCLGEYLPGAVCFAINMISTGEVDILGNLSKAISLNTEIPSSDSTWGEYACPFLFEGLNITTLRKIRLPLNFSSSDFSSTNQNRGRFMYQGLFANTTITNPGSIPNNFLPSYTIPYGAYSLMFFGSNITSVPKKIFRNGRYITSYRHGSSIFGRFAFMFANCEDLEEVGDIFTNTGINEAYYDFAGTFANCTSLSDMSGLRLKSIYTQNGAFYGMFAGSSITKSPLLYDSAIYSSYAYMFKNCNNLNEIWAYFDPTQGWNGGPVSLTDWVNGVAASGTFHYKTGMIWTTGNDGIPTGWSSIAENVETPEYFYVNSASANTYSINLKRSPMAMEDPESVPEFTIYYSEDGSLWSELGSTADLDTETPITFSGTKIYLKATTTRWRANDMMEGDYIQINATNNFSVGGNICSLLVGDDWISTQVDVPSKAFANLFQESNVNSVSGLQLTSIKSVGQYSFYQTFSGCTNLAYLPTQLLPTYLEVNGEGSFQEMFSGTGITNIPGIITPEMMVNTGNVWANDTFRGMFSNCTSLSTINNSALVLNEIEGNIASSYNEMFSGCTGLKAGALEYLNLPLDPVPSNMYVSMFMGCTSIVVSPELSASEVGSSSYASMFQGCSGLNKVYIKAEELGGQALDSWLSGVANSGNFYYKDGTSSLYPINSTSGIPTGWTGSVVSYDIANPIFINKSQNSITLNFTGSGSSGDYSYPLNYYNYSTMSGGTVYSTSTYTIPAGTAVRLSLNSGWTLSSINLRNTTQGNYLNIRGRWYTPNDLSLLKGDNFGNTDITELYVPGGAAMNFSYLFSNTQRAIPSWFYDKLKENQNKNLFMTFYGYQFEDAQIPQDLMDAIEGIQGTITNAQGLFQSSNITSIPDLSVFKKLEGKSGVFRGCSNLVSIGGSITVDTSKTYNYSSWFSGCTSLSSVPRDLLPSTTLSSSCYSSMFSGCTSLTQGPDLPASEMIDYCYGQMFYGCTSLTLVRIWATNPTLTTGYSSILGNTTQPGTWYRKSGITGWTRGANGVPSNWTLSDLPKEPKDTYFYLENTGNTAATIGLTHTNPGMMWEPFTGGTIYTSTDESTWTSWGSWSASTDEETMETTWTKNGASDITLAAGSRLYFKCAGEMMSRGMGGGEESAGQYFTMTGSTLKAGGNIWSMRVGDNFTSYTNLANNIGPIFKNCTALTNVDDLCIANPGSSVGGSVFGSLLSYTGITSLPSGFFDNIVSWGGDSAGMAEYSFTNMFQGCTGLSTINGTYLFKTPTNIQDYSNYTCDSMFQGCSNLTTVPGKLFSTTFSIPADSTHGIGYTFYYMFSGCTRLTSTPDINVVNANTLDNEYTGIFSGMFSGCTSLNNVRMSVSNTSWAYNNSTTGAFGGWLERVANSGTLYTTSDSIWATSSTSGIPSGWTRVNS